MRYIPSEKTTFRLLLFALFMGTLDATLYVLRPRKPNPVHTCRCMEP